MKKRVARGGAEGGRMRMEREGLGCDGVGWGLVVGERLELL